MDSKLSRCLRMRDAMRVCCIELSLSQHTEAVAPITMQKTKKQIDSGKDIVRKHRARC